MWGGVCGVGGVVWGVGVGCGSGLYVGWGSEREGLQSRRHFVQLYSDALAVPTEASMVHKNAKIKKAENWVLGPGVCTSQI